MSEAENKSLVLRYFLESHNPPYRLEVIDETCTPEYAEQQKTWHQMEREAFPDKHFDIEEAIAEGDKVVLRWRFRGTHSGAFWTPAGTIPATGRPLTLTATLIYRLEDGKIAEEWAALDWLSVVQQLGAQVILPAANGAGSSPDAS